MSHHYQQIFKVCVGVEREREREREYVKTLFSLQMPENLKKEVQKRLELLSAGKVSADIQQ